MQEQTESSKKTAQEAYAALTDKLIDAWSESQLKEFCDKNGINGAYRPVVSYKHQVADRK
jgi:hypothetical protein